MEGGALPGRVDSEDVDPVCNALRPVLSGVIKLVIEPALEPAAAERPSDADA